MAFSFDRRLPGSLIAGAAATAAFWAVFVPLYRAAAPVPGMEAPAARLAHAAALLVWPALLVLLMVLAVMLSRVAAAAFDPLRDAEPQYLRVGQRVLANSVEQTAILVPALLALAPGLDSATLPALPILVLLFVAGRLLFWAGYLAGPTYRTVGMVLTLNATVTAVAWAVWRAVA